MDPRERPAGSLPTGALIDAVCRDRGDHPAIVSLRPEVSLSYEALRLQSDRAARGLIALGLAPGDRVALWAKSSPEWVVVQVGAAKAGVVLVPVNPTLRPVELEFVLGHCGAAALLLDLPPEALDTSRLPALRTLVSLGDEAPAGGLAWSGLLEAGDRVDAAALAARAAAIAADDVVMVSYTSGTTGVPKGVVLTHAGTLWNTRAVAAVMGFGADDTLAVPVPLFHCFGCVLGTLLPLVAGGTVALVPRFTPRTVLETVEAFRCTALHGVPSMFLAELETLARHPADLSSLRTGIIGATVCAPTLVRQIVETLGMKELVVAYGLTEASPIVTATRRDDSPEVRTTTVGRPLPGVGVRLVDPVRGGDVPEGSQGELLCRGPGLMKGYYLAPEATARAIDPDGWLHTGDLATSGPDGSYRITGRAKDLIIRGGENIAPREVEEFLLGYEGIADAQVVGVPSPRLGEEVAAFVKARPGATLDEAAVRRFCLQGLARDKVPAHLFVVEEFPATASGKVKKGELRELAKERLGLERDSLLDVPRAASLTLVPGRDDSSAVFDFVDAQLEPWGVPSEVAIRAASVLNEALETVQALGLADGPLEVRFGYDGRELTLEVGYAGIAPSVDATEPPVPPDGSDAWLLSVSRRLIARFCDSFDVAEADGRCRIRTSFRPRERATGARHQ